MPKETHHPILTSARSVAEATMELHPFKDFRAFQYDKTADTENRKKSESYLMSKNLLSISLIYKGRYGSELGHSLETFKFSKSMLSFGDRSAVGRGLDIGLSTHSTLSLVVIRRPPSQDGAVSVRRQFD